MGPAVDIENIFQAPRGKLKIALVCAIIFIVAFLVYSGTLRGDFIWDDEYLILNNSQIKSFTHFPNVFKTYVGYGSENINNFYRPVQEISNMVDWFLWGEYPFGFHLTNVVLHSLVSALVFIFLLLISRNIMASGLAALLWAVHPVHTEAVAYIAGRADPLYAFFMLLSIIAFVRYADSVCRGKRAGWLYILSVVLFLLSLLSKEIIISMPIIIFLYTLYFLKGTQNDRYFSRLKWSWIPYGVIVVIYGALRSTVLSFSDIAPASVFGKIPLALRLLTFFRTVGVYLRLMLVPVNLHMERTIRISSGYFGPGEILALVMVAAIIWGAWYSYRHNRVVSFAIAWFFVNLLPVSNIVPINSFLAEHWIYMASIGPFMIVGVGFEKLYGKFLSRNMILRGAGLLAAACVLAVYAKMSIIRNRDWADEISFFNSTLRFHPRNARLYLNLGNTYYERGQIDQAIEQYRKSIDINKNYAVAYGNIGSAYLNKGQEAKAEEYLIKAINLKHNYPIAHYNLGIVLFKRGKYAEAKKEFEIALQQLPQLFQAWNMLARTELKLGDLKGAKTAFQRSLSIQPKQPGIRRALEKFPK